MHSATHQELVFRVKGDAEDRGIVTPERFLLAAVRHLHHLDHEVTAQQGIKSLK